MSFPGILWFVCWVALMLIILGVVYTFVQQMIAAISSMLVLIQNINVKLDETIKALFTLNESLEKINT